MPARRRLIVANWKMHKAPQAAVVLAQSVLQQLEALPGAWSRDLDLVVCPPEISLEAVSKALAGSEIGVGAQNAHWEQEGAYTGEVGPAMILTVGGTHVILGHSERRQYFAESDASVNRKLRAVLATGLSPILCCGENLEQRETGDFREFVLEQIEAALDGVGIDDAARLTLAYEPIWAIGTGKTATAAQAENVHHTIRSFLASRFSSDAADAIRILYGGSVKPDNAGALFAQKNIDGGLVGGASLEPASFAAIVAAKG